MREEGREGRGGRRGGDGGGGEEERDNGIGVVRFPPFPRASPHFHLSCFSLICLTLFPLLSLASPLCLSLSSISRTSLFLFPPSLFPVVFLTTEEQLTRVEELGLLVDKDDQGVLLQVRALPTTPFPPSLALSLLPSVCLMTFKRSNVTIYHHHPSLPPSLPPSLLPQIFTRPVGDRPTLFLEVIQRLGCTHDKAGKALVEQAPGCGGFGKVGKGGRGGGRGGELSTLKILTFFPTIPTLHACLPSFLQGNFSELFKSIEEYEKTLHV